MYALQGVSLDIRCSEVIGLLGESGSGKSTLAAAMLRLLPPHARCETGSMRFQNRDLSAMTDAELREIRGRQFAMIHQDPAMALNPVMQAGDQVAEVLRAHTCLSRKERRALVQNVFEEVGLPGHVYDAYPHQLSGGHRQRVAIAQAIVCRPALVIADEPTSKLDSELQAEMVGLLAGIRERHGTAFLVISHDPAMLAGFADRIAVMYAGQIVEEGETRAVMSRPLHPYTEVLVRIATQSGLRDGPKPASFLAIRGEGVDAISRATGCPFEPRCPDKMAECSKSNPIETSPEEHRRVSCFKYEC